MGKDRELVDLLSISDEALEMMAEEEFIDRDDLKAERYTAALGRLMNTKDGRTVIFHWLDMAKLNGKTFQPNSNIYKNAALKDYAQDRVTEICAANPKAYLKLLLECAKEETTDALDSEKD